jgi:hypothetical protein
MTGRWRGRVRNTQRLWGCTTESEACWWPGGGVRGVCECRNRKVEWKMHSAPDGVKDVGGKGPLPSLLVVLKNLLPHPLHPGTGWAGNHELLCLTQL